MPDTPLLGAAMIVRDEERHLAACLASLSAVVDDVVVVDTGSTDGSVEIAESYGARVFHHPWEGDFSRARNVALDHMITQWVLYVDADERLRPADAERLGALLSETGEVAFRVLLRPLIRYTPYREYRLWRNDPRIRFRGVIHEKIVYSIEDVATADGRTIGDCDLVLDHVGYEGDQQAKHRRNLPMLEAQLAVEPDNVFNWRHLATVLAGLGRFEEAERALTVAVALVRSRPVPAAQAAAAWADLVRHRHERGLDVAELLAEGRVRWPHHWLLVWIEGQFHQAAGRHDEAVACFRQLLEVDVDELPATGVSYDERIFGSFAQAALGLSLFRQGRYRAAAEAYAAAEHLEPGLGEYRVKRQLAESRSSRQGMAPR